MGIISEIGRKDIKVRALVWFISISLILGAITMVYPFALMISGSSKSSVDKSENQLIPGFLQDERIFYAKTVEGIFDERSNLFQSSYDMQNGDFKQLALPDEKRINPQLVNLWEKFIKKRDYPHYYFALSFIDVKDSKNSSPINLRRFKAMLSKRFKGNLGEMNEAMELELPSWNLLFVRPAEYLTPRIMPNTETELYNTFYTFKERLFDEDSKYKDLVNRFFFNPEGYFKNIYLRAQYTQKIGNYNAKNGTKYSSWDEVKLTRYYPADKKKYTDQQRKDWDDFVRTLLNRLWIKVNPDALSGYQNYLEAKYGGKIGDLNRLYGTKYKKFTEIKLVTQQKKFPFFGSRLSDWDQYIKGWADANGKLYKIPVKYLEVTGALYDFRNYVKSQYKSITEANDLFDAANKNWEKAYKNWQKKLTVNTKAKAPYQAFLKEKYNNNIVEFNKLFGAKYKSFDEIEMPTELDSFESYRKRLYDWSYFVVGWNSNGKQYKMPVEHIKLTDKVDVKCKSIVDARKNLSEAKSDFVKQLAAARIAKEALIDYIEFLKTKYVNSIHSLNKKYKSKYKNFDEIKLVSDLKSFPAYGPRLLDLGDFISGWQGPKEKIYKLASKDIKPAGIDKTISKAAKSIATAEDQLELTSEKIFDINFELYKAGKEFHIDSWSDIKSQQQAYHYKWIKANSGIIKWEFIRRNFISVFDYIVLHGYAIWNTFVYCASAVLCALIVNPLAAYALSRFNPPSTYKILLFLMVTMAFPPMVTQIPVFLLLREFSLLNTYGALILPGLANGYSVFLLKGFFDSLPKELYESAQIDGASEARIFLQITMSLSKPILAVIALQTFQFAYSNFMMALLYCQDENMWTIMPWLYQLQTNSCQGVIFASLIVAALPTFLVFTFCQNIIMRGIVVPVEK